MPKRALNGLLEIRASQLRVCGERSQLVSQVAPKETPPLAPKPCACPAGVARSTAVKFRGFLRAAAESSARRAASSPRGVWPLNTEEVL